MEENPLMDLAFTGLNIAVFFAAAGTTYLLRNKFKTGLLPNAIILLASTSLLVYLINGHAATVPSKYTTFDIDRCATRREIQQRFRQWSRTIHPDQAGSKTAKHTFEELDTLKDFLSADHTRTFYDKFDIVFDHDNFEETQVKTIHNYIFQRRLFQYLNSTFIWVFLTFIMCKVLRELDITNFLLKILMGKAFVVVYFMYAQPVDECSALDRWFPRLTIFQQIKHAELVFSLGFGILAATVFEYKRRERAQLMADVGKAREAAEKLEGDHPAVKELKESLKKFAELASN